MTSHAAVAASTSYRCQSCRSHGPTRDCAHCGATWPHPGPLTRAELTAQARRAGVSAAAAYAAWPDYAADWDKAPA